MSSDGHFSRFNFKFSQCSLLEEISTTTHRKKSRNQFKNKQIQKEEQLIVRPMNEFERNVSF